MSSQDRAAIPITRQMMKPQLDRADVVIIGNGIAGLTAAIETRRHSPDKQIVIITDQIHPTINTPALKQFAIGKLAQEQLLAYPAGTERAERIHVVTARVEEIHAQDKYVVLSGGRGFGYGALLIATGSTPRGLPASMPGRDFDGVLTLHRLQDYMDLRRRLAEVREAVVVGGGAHAIETVMGLHYWGIHVHWFIRGKNFMQRILDTISSDMVLDGVLRAGISVRTETEIVGVVGRVGSVAGVVTNHQEMIPCQLVLTCTGEQAAMTLATHCDEPLRHKQGILVDDQLRTSIRDIYAAGDVAALKNPLTGEYETRAQWYAAVSQGRTAAAMIAGHEELARKPFGVQWHATHLGEQYMLTVGNPLSEGNKVMTLTDNSQGGYRRLAIVDDRLVGYLSLGNAQPDSLSIKRIIDEGHSVRDITRALLKGNVDARKYLSEVRSRAAQGLFTGTVPRVASSQRPAANVPLLPPPVPPRPQTDPQSPVRQTDPLRQLAPAARQEQAVVYEQDAVSPFTGNLPNIRGPIVQEEEISPFTGNLPHIQGPIVESTLVPAPTPAKQAASSLWSYSKAPQGKQSDKKQGTTKREDTLAGSRGHTSGSLWSYSNQDKR